MRRRCGFAAVACDGRSTGWIAERFSSAARAYRRRAAVANAGRSVGKELSTRLYRQSGDTSGPLGDCEAAGETNRPCARKRAHGLVSRAKRGAQRLLIEP